MMKSNILVLAIFCVLKSSLNFYDFLCSQRFTRYAFKSSVRFSWFFATVLHVVVSFIHLSFFLLLTTRRFPPQPCFQIVSSVLCCSTGGYPIPQRSFLGDKFSILHSKSERFLFSLLIQIHAPNVSFLPLSITILHSKVLGADLAFFAERWHSEVMANLVDLLWRTCHLLNLGYLRTYWRRTWC